MKGDVPREHNCSGICTWQERAVAIENYALALVLYDLAIQSYALTPLCDGGNDQTEKRYLELWCAIGIKWCNRPAMFSPMPAGVQYFPSQSLVLQHKKSPSLVAPHGLTG